MTFSPAGLPPEYSRFRRRLVMGLVTVACLAIIAVSWKIHSSYREREDAARERTQSIVHAVAAHMSDSIQLVDFALIGFANAIKVLPPEQRNSAATIRQLLARHDPASSDDFGSMFVDANGVGVASSKGIAVQGVSFADRDYFQAQAAADQGLYVSEPLIARVSKRRIFTLSRRVVSAQGEFLGVIVAPVNAARFAAMFELARFNNKDISIALVHQRGKMIARAPLFEQMFAANLLNTEVFRQMRAAPEQTFQANSTLDGKPMLYSFRSLENLPLDVFVGISVKSLRQALEDDLLMGGAGILLMLTIMLLSAQVALTAYRRLETSRQALQESELRLKFALEAAGQGVWDWNIVSNAVYFSSDWKQMLEYADDVEMENTFDAWESGIHPDDKPRVMAELHRCLEGRTPIYLSEYRMRRKDGSWKWLLGRGIVVSRDAAGQALRMTGTYADVTDRKQAEQAQVHKIIEAAPDPMLLVGNDGIIVFANGATETAFGYAPNELKGMNVDQLVPLHSRSSHAHYRKAFETSRTQHPNDAKRPLAAVYKDGTEFPVEISLSPISMDGQPVVIASIRDISERKRAA
ncbi:MAG: PAS domain S-box protein, partial [Oxalobacteraceae bacterium]|nr:PAS domain S-box protein [Oxalobacteraceae bacterium]